MVTQQFDTFALPASLDLEAIEDLRSRLAGTVILSHDEDYDDARTVWNGRVNRYPALIVRCATAADIAVAVRFARANNLRVSVRGGGHNVTGSAIVEGGLAIDLRGMKKIDVDPENHVARVQPGVVWGEFFRETGKYGLATTGGQVGTVGVPGVTLGGGIGWLTRKYGMTIDNLIGAEIVTAEGEILRADDLHNPDLFWAIRGGGGNFGVAASFEFRLHPVSTVVAGMVLHPIVAASDVLKFYRDYTRDAPDELTTMAVLHHLPHVGHVVSIGACYSGDPEEGMRVVQPLLEFGPPVGGQIGPMPLTVLQSMFDEGGKVGMRHHMRSGMLNELSDDAIDAIVHKALDMTSHLSQVHIVQLGGAMARVAPGATAFPHRDARYMVAAMSAWAHDEDDDHNIGWIEALWASAEPYTTGGVYVNYLSNEGPARVRAAYGENYARLSAIKAKYDPTNFFHVNQNIQPDAR
jgi:FAD/FMN-containing dehydrogenase